MKTKLLALSALLVLSCAPSEAGVITRIAKKTLAVGIGLVEFPITAVKAVGVAVAYEIYATAWRFDEIDREQGRLWLLPAPKKQ